MIIDCIGCLHGSRPKMRGGDLLIVTGDHTYSSTQRQFEQFDRWLDAQKYSKKIFIAGNHDKHLINEKPKKYKIKYGENEREKFEYLCDSGTEFDGLKIWGSPWTPAFKGINPRCTAFTIPLGEDTEYHLMDKWKEIPHDIDILITHGPPFGVLDGIPSSEGSLLHVGSTSLYGWLRCVKRPRLHVFSHIHEAYGQTEHFTSYYNKTISVNCSIMNEYYQPVNKPIRIIL